MTTGNRRSKITRNQFERAAWALENVIVGVDEVGRGCLAGPVVAAAVMLWPNSKHKLLQDSKILTHEQRLEAYQWIIKHSWHAIGIIGHRVIDRDNIYKATQRAMARALFHLLAHAPHTPTEIVIDAMPLDVSLGFPGTIHHFPFGESLSCSIAAASIIAKVTRDALMDLHHANFPAYGLAGHKGYATPQHIEALRKYGENFIQRTTFKWNHDEKTGAPTDAQRQETLF
jgi:ribonuclease HII